MDNQAPVGFQGRQRLPVKVAVLIPLRKGQLLKLYLLAIESMGSLLAQDDKVGHERVAFYLRQLLNEDEHQYTPIEKMCLSLYYSCTKLRCYLLPTVVHVICLTDLIS